MYTSCYDESIQIECDCRAIGGPLSSRRDWIKLAALLPAGLAFARSQTLNACEDKSASVNRPSVKIKLSVNAWSYYIRLNKYLKGESGGMSLFDMLEECARLEVDAIDPTGYFFPGYPNVPDSKFINDAVSSNGWWGYRGN